MDEYREYISTLRELELQDVYFLLHENMTPMYTKYVKMVRDLPFEDGTYKRYYLDMKKIITSFHHYFIEKIDKTIKEVDRYTHTASINTIVDLCEKTIEKYRKKQINFESDFLPVKTPEEKDCYDRIKKKMDIFVEKLNAMSDAVQRLDKQFKVDAFARKYLPASLENNYEKFIYTHMFLSRMLAARVTYIDTSISEINIGVCHRFKRCQNKCEEAINCLLHQLYNVNKESLRLHQRHLRCAIDHEEVDKTINLIREKIDEYYPKDTPLQRLQEEIQYWTRKSQEMDHIASALAKLKNERTHLDKLQRILLDDYCSCFSEKLEEVLDEELLSAEEIKIQKLDVQKRYDEVARCLFTFFSCRGNNLIYYRDNVGQYYIDEYGHKVYCFEHGLEKCHMFGDGRFQDLDEVEKKFFNEYGAYVFEESIEHASEVSVSSFASSSTNSFFLENTSSDNLINEHTSIVSKSRAEKTKEIDIRNILDEATVKYLWDAFGSILPDALYDVYKAKPRNPIHCLAANLLKHKYSRGAGEQKLKEEEAKKYRNKCFIEVHVKNKAEALAWKSKMPKRHMSEELYENDIQNLFINQHDFILGSHFTY